MTAKENYLKILNGEMGEWIPYYNDVSEWVIIDFLLDFFNDADMIDSFSVKWHINDAGIMPDWSCVKI